MNKLTKDNFAKLSEKLAAIPLTSVALLVDVLSAIFDKALAEKHFGEPLNSQIPKFGFGKWANESAGFWIWRPTPSKRANKSAAF